MTLLIPTPGETSLPRIVTLLRQAIQYVNLILPSRGQVLGSNTNATQSAGYIGEVLAAAAAAGTTPLTTGTPLSISSVPLTPGAWLCFGVTSFTPAATTNVTRSRAALSTTVDTLATGQNALNDFVYAPFVPNAVFFNRVGPQVFRVATATTLYTVAQLDFTVSTATCGATTVAIRLY